MPTSSYQQTCLQEVKKGVFIPIKADAVPFLTRGNNTNTDKCVMINHYIECPSCTFIL